VTGGTPLVAPIPGIVIHYNVKVGDEVKESDVVMVLEAMKMVNDIVSPVSGKIKAINYKDGDHVKSGDVLAVIG
jgi:biotin carboxyl carrier protein